MKKKNRYLILNIILMAVPVLTLIFHLLPFATYTYGSAVYDFTGLQLLLGADIGQGSVSVEPMAVLWVSSVGCVALFAVSIWGRKAKKALFGRISFVLSLALFVLYVVISKQSAAALEGVKNITGGYGVLCALITLFCGILCSVMILYKETMVDGAGRWKQFSKITLPCLKPTVITLVLLSVGRIFYSDFGLFYQIPMNSGILNSVTQTIDTYVYRALTNTSSLSRAAAAGALQSVIGFALIMVVNGVVRKVDQSNALF